MYHIPWIALISARRWGLDVLTLSSTALGRHFKRSYHRTILRSLASMNSNDPSFFCCFFKIATPPMLSTWLFLLTWTITLPWFKSNWGAEWHKILEDIRQIKMQKFFMTIWREVFSLIVEKLDNFLEIYTMV